MTVITNSSKQFVNLITLEYTIKSVDVPAATNELMTPYSHPYGKTPFFIYDISFDGLTYYPPPYYYTGDASNDKNYIAIMMYTDQNNVYNHYIWTTNSRSNKAFSYWIRYKLLVTEQTK